MIKYQLRCRCNHEFEGWFPDSKEYKRQKNKGLINCPMCDSTAVDKAIMAPAVKTSKKKKFSRGKILKILKIIMRKGFSR